MTKTEATKKLHSSVKGKFTQTANNLDQAIDAGALIKTIKSRYGKLLAAWKEVQEKHDDDDFVKLLPGEGLDEEWIEELNNTFNELEVKTDSYLEDVGKAKAQEIELKILKETEEAKMRARQLAEINKEENERAREREKK